MPTEVVGVTPPAFFGTDQGVSPDITIPLDNPVQLANVWATVRLKEGVSDKQAQADADVALQGALELMRPGLANYRESDREEILTQRALLTRGDRGLGEALGSYTDSLQTLMLLSGVVLLIACVNIANVFLARFAARTHETGVRLELGASRRRLVQQFVVESALLSAIAAMAGLVLAFWMQRALVLLLMDDEARQAIHFKLNAHVLAFSAAAAIVALLLFGLVPALRATNVEALSLLKREASGTRLSRSDLAKGLIVVQIAASLLLLFGCGLASTKLHRIEYPAHRHAHRKRAGHENWAGLAGVSAGTSLIGVSRTCGAHPWSTWSGLGNSRGGFRIRIGRMVEIGLG
jgi:FtsX-like permease family